MTSAAALACAALAFGFGCKDRAAVPAPPALPGAIWSVDGPDPHAPPTVLVRLAAGARTEVTGDGEGRRLFASPWASPDGGVVAIASRADGGPDGERLVIVGADGKVTPVGPPALQIRDPAVDPRGRWIVAATMVDGVSELFRYELGAGAGPPVRITFNKEGNFHPAVLADMRIAYVSSRDGDSELYASDVTGDAALRLTAFHKDDWEPAVAPDGKTIAFLSDREGSARIYLMAPDGTSQRRFTARTGMIDEADPVWSPDGARIAYRAGAAVWLRDVTAGTERSLTPDGKTDYFPAFSPDGRYVAVERDAAIWVIPVDGGAPIRIGAGRMPRWLAR